MILKGYLQSHLAEDYRSTLRSGARTSGSPIRFLEGLFEPNTPSMAIRGGYLRPVVFLVMSDSNGNGISLPLSVSPDNVTVWQDRNITRCSLGEWRQVRLATKLLADSILVLLQLHIVTLYAKLLADGYELLVGGKHEIAAGQAEADNLNSVGFIHVVIENIGPATRNDLSTQGKDDHRPLLNELPELLEHPLNDVLKLVFGYLLALQILVIDPQALADVPEGEDQLTFRGGFLEGQVQYFRPFFFDVALGEGAGV